MIEDNIGESAFGDVQITADDGDSDSGPSPFGDVSDGFGLSALYGGEVSDGFGTTALYEEEVNEAAEAADEAGVELDRAEISLRSSLSGSSPSEVVESTSEQGGSQIVPIPVGSGGSDTALYAVGGVALLAVVVALTAGRRGE